MPSALGNQEPRWRRMGLRDDGRIEEIQEDLKYWGRYLDVYGPTTPQSPSFESHTGRRQDIFVSYEILQVQHLEYSHPFGDIRNRLVTMSELAVDYFCGAWRDHTRLYCGEVLNRQECRQRFDWFDEFRMGLVAALLARRREDLRQIASYIDRDLPEDEGVWDRTKDDRDFFIVAATFMQDKGFAGCEDLLESLARSHRRRPRTMLACLKGIVDRRDAEVAAELQKCLKQYRDMELDTAYARIVTSIDGTLLWNLAENEGLRPAPLSTELMDLIITRTSLGLDECS